MGTTWSSWSTGEPPPSMLVHKELSQIKEESEEVRDEDRYLPEEMNDFYEKIKVERDEEMIRFKEDLAARRKAREEAVERLRREITQLREKERERVEKGVEEGDEWDQLREKVKKTEELEKQVEALKDVANIGKQILAIREKQVAQLTERLKALEETGAEYEAEVVKVRRLRELYEERERAREEESRVELEREKARAVVAETRLRIAAQEATEASDKSIQLEERNKELSDKVESLSKLLDDSRDEVSELRIELATRSQEVYEGKTQLGLVNGLFEGVLTGKGSDQVDRLAKVLEENRPLLVDLTAKGRIHQVASVLMDVAEPTPQSDQPTNTNTSIQDFNETPSSEEISTNLNKVWSVMVELMSHQKRPLSQGGNESSEPPPPGSCYKSVETPKGKRMVISPSQTFIRLKDLILEKNSLVKEVGRLKVLNCHLESRLGEQEKRLSTVTVELRKTWGVVNKLRTQHKQLHTQEKILRYELQHKRALLADLKRELERCRDQWERARVKNSQTEEDWKLLREEFASRKKLGVVGGGESTESGFEDEDGSCEEEVGEGGKEGGGLKERQKERKEVMEGVMEREDGSAREPHRREEVIEGKTLDNDEGGGGSESRVEPGQPPPDKPLPPESMPSGSRIRTTEEILEAREARLKRMEEQCKSLFNKMSSTSSRSDAISNRLEELHQQYSGERRTSVSDTPTETDTNETNQTIQ